MNLRPEIFIAAILLTFACSRKPMSDSRQVRQPDSGFVELTVYRNDPYCSGVRPPFDMNKTGQKPKALAAETFFVKSGEQNNPDLAPLDSAVTDESGKLRFSLPPGKYCLVRRDKVDRRHQVEMYLKYEQPTKDYSAIDKACFQEWLKRPDFIFQVEKNKSLSLTLTVDFYCWWKINPCVQYRGPLPP